MAIMTSRCSSTSRSDYYNTYRCVVFVLTFIVEFASADSDVAQMRLRKILDTSYDRNKSPRTTEDSALTVQVSLHVRELLLSENDMTMSLRGVDVLQSWTDPRLAAVTQDKPDLHLYKDSVDVIWTPDLHVINARAQLPPDHRTLTVSRAGLVLLQQRLSVDVLCPNFTSHMKPLVCSLQIQPYSSTESEVVFEWGSVTLEPHLNIPKYSLVELETGSCNVATSIGAYCCKRLAMSFRADVNFFATEVYGASFLLVALSWTGFWVDGSSMSRHGGNPAVRLGLGLVIVLILVVYGVGFRLLHNKVGVPGNVEVWVAFCTLFVLASLVEYVFVHILLCTVPAQLRHVCCKRNAPQCCQQEHDALPPTSADDERASFKKAARVIDVTCGILFPLIFVLFNVAYWVTY